MKELNLQPFYVGQRVVCVDDQRSDGRMSPIKKGETFKVKGFWRCGCSWLVDVGIKSPTLSTYCPHCCETSTDGVWYFWATRFAPIEETFQSITLEKILEEETKLIGVN